MKCSRKRSCALRERDCSTALSHSIRRRSVCIQLCRCHDNELPAQAGRIVTARLYLCARATKTKHCLGQWCRPVSQSSSLNEVCKYYWIGKEQMTRGWGEWVSALLALMVQPVTCLKPCMCVSKGRSCGWVWVYLMGVGLAIKWRMTGSNYSNALLCSVAGLRCQLRVIRPDMRWIATRLLSPSQVGWPTPLPPR